MTTVTKLLPETVEKMLEDGKVKNRMSPSLAKKLKKLGWKFSDYSIEKKTKSGIYVEIEFCIGDFCVYPCSKKGHWLLEGKSSHKNFGDAFFEATLLEVRANSGEHWPGEND